MSSLKLPAPTPGKSPSSGNFKANNSGGGNSVADRVARVNTARSARHRDAVDAKEEQKKEDCAGREKLMVARALPPLNNRVVPATPAGELYAWGTSVYGCLGLGTDCSSWIPKPVQWGEHSALVSLLASSWKSWGSGWQVGSGRRGT
jgi:hypothetical protein